MLKIKDNIDLKQLEKFGFELFQGASYIKEFDATMCVTDNMFHEIIIYVENRSIALNIVNSDYLMHTFNKELGGIEDTIFDLIQANLVEKVEG